MFARLKEDIGTIMTRDPAARSWVEVLLAYPGVHAIIVYRVSNWLWKRDWTTLARVLSHIAKVFTGVEIHPGATLGRRVFIDHATGVVIGETAEVGDDVTLYQGVTLGGTSLEKGKRHPTLEHGVIVGSGAAILGPITVGHGARIGANAVVLKDVPAGATMVGIPAKAVLSKTRVREDDDGEFCAYGVPRDDLPDPVARAMDSLSDQVCTLSKRIEELEARLAGAPPRVVVPCGGAATTEPDGQEAARPHVVVGGAEARRAPGAEDDDEGPAVAAGGGNR